VDCFQTWDDSIRGHATNIIIEGNICINPDYQAENENGQGFMLENSGTPGGIIVKNNLIYAYHGLNSIGVNNLTVVNNTFIGDLNSAHTPLAFYGGDDTNTVIKNNILYNFHANVVITGGGVTGGKNLTYHSDGTTPSNDSAYNNSNDLWGVNPQFINTTDPLSSNYFRLQTGSPACNGGENGTYIGAFPCGIVPNTIPGDANGDSHVDVKDFGIWFSNYHKTGSSIFGDFDSNNYINGLDYSIMIKNYGKW
jgi:hypothetical protein